MADEITTPLAFKLTATTGMDGAPTYHAQGDFGPMPELKVTKADVTQALPPPNGILPIENPTGSYEFGPLPNFQVMKLTMRIRGEVTHQGTPAKHEAFASTSEFEFHPPLKPGVTLKGTTSFGHGPHEVKNVPTTLVV